MAKAVKADSAIDRKMISGQLDLREEGATREQLFELGKRLKAEVALERHAEWFPPKNRPNPVATVLASNKGRVKELVPLRMARMAASPFTFLRGAAAVMAWDLSTTPNIGHNMAMD